MMTKLFLLQLFLTFTVGTGWIYLTVQAGLHFGSKTSGFIAGLPSTALLSFFFIGYTQTPSIAAHATTVFPIAMTISGIFLLVYAWLIRKGFLLAISAALIVWFALSFLVLKIRPVNFGLNLAIYGISMVIAFLILEKYFMLRSIPGKKTHTSHWQSISRSLFGGLIITITVLIAKAGGPVMGGIFAGFPAMFIATLVISYKVQGAEFSRALTKSLLVTGMITIAVYAVSVKYLYPPAGLYLGTLIAICIAAVSAFLTFRYILPQIK